MLSPACVPHPPVRLHVLARSGHDAALRLLLGELTGTPPEQLRFRGGPYGKPRLAGGSPLGFNVSHSGTVCVVALVERGEVGVDVERVDRRRAGARSAARVMTPAELQRWEALPRAQRARAFFELWTAKEACAKALGCGLSLSPHAVDLACRDASGAVCVAGARLSLRPISPAPGYVGTLAVQLPS